MRSSLSEHMEKVKMNRQCTLRSEWIRLLAEIDLDSIYPGEMIFNLTGQAGSLAFVCPAPFRMEGRPMIRYGKKRAVCSNLD